MSATFPFVEPSARLEAALWSVFHCHGNKALAAVLTSLWELWGLYPMLSRRVLASRSALLKVVVVRILRAASVHSPSRNIPIDQLHTLLQLLHFIVSGSIILQRFAKQVRSQKRRDPPQFGIDEVRKRFRTGQLDARVTIEQNQHRFSEFTSGWKLCADLCEILSCSLIICQEFAIDMLDVKFSLDQTDPTDDGTCSVISVRTSRSVGTATARFEFKKAHFQSAIAKDVIQEDRPAKKFKLKTLEEHRYATRFQEKRITAKTWRSALREAHKLIQSGDRASLVEALYLLLEIIWLDPRGGNLATMYLDTGSIYLAFDHLEEAAKAYRNSIRLDESNWKARYNLGIATARLEDFVEATRQLKVTLKSCPDDIAEEIHAILKEIDRIQCTKNLRAFHETTKARVFTTQYLESQYLVFGAPVSASATLQEDHTVSHRKGLALTSNPQLLDVSHEWQGVLASLLHCIYVSARCQRLSIQAEMLRLDPGRTSGISAQAFEKVVNKISGIPLRETERSELVRMLDNFGATTFHFLSPNTESVNAFEEIQRQGACHALLDWKLYRKRAKRSAKSRDGGLWLWFDLTMAKWIERVLPQLSPEGLALTLIEVLLSYGWLSPMDFAWKWRHLPEPDNFPMLPLADRGVLIYECHCARRCIQEEASRTLQMFLRRFLVGWKWRRRSRLIGTRHFNQKKSRTDFQEDIHVRLARDTLFDQVVAREVFQCIEDIIDDVVVRSRLQLQAYEEEVRWQEIPVRTEQRQKVISAIGEVQTAVKSRDC
ncbi:hypothetical protein V7S43_007966 [Phytophthora oleae]|uniref:Uncharacterized protein n=1 Tax=Phytophthora oleae TaxID=2107226 RepID=A0ABD3FL34_9STRA